MRKYFEEFEPGSVRDSTGRTITETDIVLHAGQTGDFYPHHMDEEWCKQQPFKKRIAHGTLVFSVAVGMTAGVINEVSMTYGYDRLRFLQPVFIGDTLRVKVTVRERKEHKRPGYGLVTEGLEVFNQRSDLVMVCDHLLLVEKRVPGDAAH
ncbi:MaoC family dehydratase [Dinghuibacter silviterrae]|uniref:Acyl dehydratase n=1 Tax=Dinghuibacter silviterrae TaxID=1539049 RepID=A0A4R8DVC8_9BACT|nr:MaoC/PaaZ C-terminal domain-containing protein [Dinghuibacter silviterrae]TDX01367.1 acyl dehydratase [Dinghuibacter silviterrae]